MKAAILALLGVSQGVTIRGIPSASLMDRQPSHWKKIWPQGDTDDGLNDDLVLNWPKVAAPPRPEHDWVPYEPHTTSMENQWTGLYHTTGPVKVSAAAAKEQEAEDAEASGSDDEEEAPKTKGAKARAATFAANPDLQPEAPTGPLVEGAGAKATNQAEKPAGAPKPEAAAKPAAAAGAAAK